LRSRHVHEREWPVFGRDRHRSRNAATPVVHLVARIDQDEALATRHERVKGSRGDEANTGPLERRLPVRPRVGARAGQAHGERDRGDGVRAHRAPSLRAQILKTDVVEELRELVDELLQLPVLTISDVDGRTTGEHLDEAVVDCFSYTRLDLFERHRSSSKRSKPWHIIMEGESPPCPSAHPRTICPI